MDFDIEVAGTGIYSIQGRSEEGAAWVRKNVQDSDPQGLAYTDDSRLALEIVKGASNDGLSVSIDGRKYTEKSEQEPKGADCKDFVADQCMGNQE
jgi:hypothetical protein